MSISNTAVELRAEAKKLGLCNYSKSRKAELIALIEATRGEQVEDSKKTRRCQRIEGGKN